MTTVIHDRAGNRLHVPPTLPRLATSQRAFQKSTAAHRERIANRELDRWDAARAANYHYPRLAQELLDSDRRMNSGEPQ